MRIISLFLSATAVAVSYAEPLFEDMRDFRKSMLDVLDTEARVHTRAQQQFFKKEYMKAFTEAAVTTNIEIIDEANDMLDEDDKFSDDQLKDYQKKLSEVFVTVNKEWAWNDTQNFRAMNFQQNRDLSHILLQEAIEEVKFRRSQKNLKRKEFI